MNTSESMVERNILLMVGNGLKIETVEKTDLETDFDDSKVFSWDVKMSKQFQQKIL